MAATAMMTVQACWIAGLCLAAVLGLFLLARISPRQPMAHMRPVLCLIAIVGLTHVVSGEAALGLAVALRLIALVLLASLVSQTTRVSDMVVSLEAAIRPLAVFGL